MSHAVADPTDLVLDDPTRRLCATIAAGEPAGVRLAMIAAGGHGKSAMLAHLARPGAVCFRSGLGAEVERPAVVLVDDAHELPDSALRELLDLAADDRIGLVVAARPRPRPPLLTELLGRLRGQIVLRPFDRSRLAACVRSVTGLAAPAEQVDFLLAQTDGVPGFVQRLAAHLDPLDPAGLPESAFEEFRFDLDRLPPDVLRLLLAAEAGAGLDVDLLAGLLDAGADAVAELIDLARATGLLRPDGTLLPIAACLLRTLVPVERRTVAFARLAELQLARGGPVLGMVTPLLGNGSGGPAVTAAFEAAAEEAIGDDPALAARLFEAAAASGRTTAGARWAEAVALSGDLDTALRLADGVLATGDAADRAEGARVAGTALAHRGQLGRSAELHQWAGTGLAGAFAAIGLVGTGRLAEAGEALRATVSDAPPTLLSGALTSAARGVLESVAGNPTTALSTLVRAAEMLDPVGRAVLLPDSPAALGALVALHSGESVIAEPLLERAVAAEASAAVLDARHRLLLAWIAMVRGNATAAAARRAEAGADLSPRDWLFAVALEVGLARRTSDLPGLRRIWEQAREAVIRHPVDLYTLLPLGEFTVAAARLGDQERLVPHLRQAWQLLSDLGDPPLWATMLHWHCLHAAIVAEHREEADRHAAALAGFADRGPYCATVSAAAQSWLAVLAGEVDPVAVEAAARGLHGAGLCWDGARLAGQAAIRTSDRKAMLGLLDCARLLQGPGAAPASAVEDGTADQSGMVRLSERETQVAELVLAGLTYKQVGDRLFISAKTVEHHVARMRSRLGAASRSDLLAQLRTLLEDRPAQ